MNQTALEGNIVEKYKEQDQNHYHYIVPKKLEQCSQLAGIFIDDSKKKEVEGKYEQRETANQWQLGMRETDRYEGNTDVIIIEICLAFVKFAMKKV